MKNSLPLVGVLTTENRKHIYKNPRPMCFAIYQVDFQIDLLKSLSIKKMSFFQHLIF
jgi:hypothetical protein